MDTINGLDFENWAAACAHLAQGMSEAEICDILGLELPVWQETNEKWAAKLGDLMTEDMNVATQYGDIFANPKVGKFATEGIATRSIDDILKIVPDFDSYQKVFWQQAIAAEHGIDATAVLEENGFNLQTWGQANMHYITWQNEYFSSELHETDVAEYKRRYDERMAIDNKWQAHWKNHYKENAVNLSEDIDF